MRIKEIEARLAAIKQEIEQRGAEMTAAEIDALVRAELMGKKELEAPMIEDEEDDEFDDLPLLGADEE